MINALVKSELIQVEGTYKHRLRQKITLIVVKKTLNKKIKCVRL